MNILMVGSGGGSFAMRGQQLGRALGARVVGAPSDDDLRWADVVVLIKRAGRAWAELVHRFGKPIVWDALDFWAQPDENSLSETQAKVLLVDWISAIKPMLVIGATQAMADACGGVYLPHHSWIGLHPTPAREQVKVVGYQGTRKYLGQWMPALQAACDRRGWHFIVNPPDLRACDLLVAFRDGKHDGWMCDEWKSGVKIVNAIAAGRPLITQASAAVRELNPVGLVIQTPDELATAFEVWTSHAARQRAVVSEDVARAYALPEIATRYRHILSGVLKAQAA